MRLVTVQDKAAYEYLCNKGVLRCNPNLAGWLREDNFKRAYDWLSAQIRLRVGEPPGGVTYPIWAWYLLDGKPAKADLRRAEFNNFKGEHYIIAAEIPDEQVLLSDEELWHIVLNNGYYGKYEGLTEAEVDADDTWFDSLPIKEKEVVRQKSWERIFDSTDKDNTWRSVQGTLWELRMEQVISVRKFIGRLR